MKKLCGEQTSEEIGSFCSETRKLDLAFIVDCHVERRHRWIEETLTSPLFSFVDELEAL